MNIPEVGQPEDWGKPIDWDELLLGPIAQRTFCAQCSRMVLKEDFDPRAGMCGACISEAMAEVPEFFAHAGIVASAEEQEAHD
jgi:hypothetical protein